MAPAAADGLRCALILVRERDNEPDHFYEMTGITRWTGDELIFEHDRGSFPLPTDTLGRLRRIDPTVDAAHDADVYLMLRLGPLPPEIDRDQLLPTGLRVPDVK